LMLFLAASCIQGQWYYKKYGVLDINYLSLEQLDEARLNTKEELVASGFIAIGGGLCYIIFRYIKPGMSEDPSFFEELLGDEGVNKLGMGCSLAAIAGGSVYWVVSMSRKASINATIRSKQSYSGSLSISPQIIPGIRSGNIYSGFAFSIKF